jgi:hypothetical protein
LHDARTHANLHRPPEPRIHTTAKECNMSHAIRTLAICGVIVASAPFTAQAAADGAQQYHVRELLVGSVLAQPIINSQVPFDRPYAGLTSAQKALLSQDYESLPAGDEPPFPLYGVRHTLMPILSYVETWNPVGELVAAVDVDSKGDAISVTVYKSPDQQLTRLASKALALEKYKPGLCKGQPCRMQYVMRLDFPDRRATSMQVLPFRDYD